MTPRVRKHLSDIEIDEISLVDRGANQHAAVTIAKRAPEEDNMPEFYSEDGELLPEDTVLDEGDVVYDESGQAYEFVLEDEDDEGDYDDGEQEYEQEDERELESVGKRGAPGFLAGVKTGFKAGDNDFTPLKTASKGAQRGHHVGNFGYRHRKGIAGGGAAGAGAAGAGGAGYAYKKTKEDSVGKSFREEMMEELSKAYSDDERDAVLSKAFDQMEQYAEGAHEAEEIAKAERDLRLTREYISKAADYNVPVAPEELGPVLYRMAETMDYDDCAVIHKALESSGAAIFDEVGYIGGGDNADVFSQVQAYANENVSKSGEEISDAETISKVFEMNPDAYDQYLAEQRGF